MRPGRAADYSSPSSAAVMEEYSYNSTHPLGHTGPVTGSLYLLTFTQEFNVLVFSIHLSLNPCICRFMAETCSKMPAYLLILVLSSAYVGMYERLK